MIEPTPEELYELAYEMLSDALWLCNGKRYKGAFYLCGYAVEMGLKYKICKVYDLNVYPGNHPQRHRLVSHKLEELLIFAKLQDQKNALFLDEWSVVTKWDPAIRYSAKKLASEDVELMISATQSLLEKICSK